MTKHLAVTTALLSTLTLGSILVQSASAETTLLAEWLINGASVTSNTSATESGEAILEDTKAGLGVKCSFSITVTLSSGGKKITISFSALIGSEVTLTAPLLCKSSKFCEESATDVEASPEKLPWNGLLELTEAGVFREITSEASYFVSCLVLGIKVSEECTDRNFSYELLNVTGGVEDNGAAKPNGECTVGGKESGEITFDPGNLLRPTAGGVLTVSE